ncbi:MAG: type II toxin-antitoxin system Phd/YefM family antitoxin [Oligoflexia bacterium]|nr:type II toxin-antitoxin system Phd/YefM family antitoxin [Oligoflexia bacterium]MBF0365232.1 type II toxin-antitoxin system Phd/YefM family antitoxin [Oligoflexia bacterium]
MKTVNIHQAKTHLSRLIEDVLNGEDVFIAKGNRPLVKLTLIENNKTREIGRLKGKIQINSDFDEPLDDFKEYEK